MNREFKREFGENLLAELQRRSIVRELFRRWALPGEVATSDQDEPLRLAVRDGTLNFYVCGQSVALIEPKKKEIISLKIHRKYFENVMKGADGVGPGGDYIRRSGDELDHPDAEKLVGEWIACAHSYRGAEKEFVEALTAKNPSVIDVEMGLPGDEGMLVAGRKIAPRMDIVTAIDQDGQLCLNFWEAKCAENDELRATPDIVLGDHRVLKKLKVGARVAHQLQFYMAWLTTPNREQQVVESYQATASILLFFAQSFNKDTKGTACQIWARLANEIPLVVRRPGIVICNYGTYEDKGPKQRAAIAKSFKENGHCERLTSLGLTVVEIPDSASGELKQIYHLPALQDGPLTRTVPE